MTYRSPDRNKNDFLKTFIDAVNDRRNRFKRGSIFLAGEYNIDIMKKSMFF